MSHIGNYDDARKAFAWEISEKELGYEPGAVINIGEYCSDRICRMGKADKLALIWEGHDGHIKRYTFNDMRQLTNTIAAFLKSHGIVAGDRVCLFGGFAEHGRFDQPADEFKNRRHIGALEFQAAGDCR